MRTIATIVLITAACLMAEDNKASARTNADGTWSVEVVTEAGQCDRSYQYPVVVENGQPRYGGAEAITISGQVASSGAVSGVISRFGGSAEVRGRLSGRTGRGRWTTTALGGCSGYWLARKA